MSRHKIETFFLLFYYCINTDTQFRKECLKLHQFFFPVFVRCTALKCDLFRLDVYKKREQKLKLMHVSIEVIQF